MAFDLSSLLKDVPDLGTGREQIEYIKLDLIDEDPNNFYQLSAIDELAANIELCRLQQPIRIRAKGGGRYQIVSGHRRRAAVAMLAQENPEKWSEVPCIIETDEVSPALQQLRLIFANAHTRKMSAAEIDRQAEEVTNLLYKLKEEGYEFPGRMRDHVAKAVGISKSKLARLKVIRENLDESWVDDYESGKLTESQAHELAKMPKTWQSILQANWPYPVPALYADRIGNFHKTCNAVQEIECQHGLTLCEHAEQMAKKNAHDYQLTPCTSCCFDCEYLRTCKNCCPEAAGKKKELRDTEKQAKREADERQAERDRPGAEFAKMVYGRIGQARKQNNVSVKALYEAQQKFYSATVDDPRQRTMESGAGKYSPVTDLPFGFNVTPIVLMKVVAVADALGCSIDYLLGRTDRMEIVPESGTIETASEPVPESGTIWHPVSEEPPVGKKLIWIDCDGTCDSGRYLGDERLDEYCVVEWKDARWWSYYPGEDV